MFGTGMWIKLGAVVAVLFAVFLGYRHYEGLLTEIQSLQGEKVALETALEAQMGATAAAQLAVGEWHEAQGALLEAVQRMQDVAASAGSEVKRLNGIFAKHDLGALAARKPGLIERRINTGSRDAQRMLQCASGAVGAECTDRPGTAGEAATAAGPPVTESGRRKVEGADAG